MILINDGVGIIKPISLFKHIKARCIKLREIMDDENATRDRRDWAYDEFIGYQEDLQNLNVLFKVPFDVLIVVQEENELHIECTDIDMTKRGISE